MNSSLAESVLTCTLCYASHLSVINFVYVRQFPGICNCTTIDWFHPWPKNALVAVAKEYLEDVDINDGDEDIKSNVPDHMAEVHLAVTEMSKVFRRKSRRTIIPHQSRFSS